MRPMRENLTWSIQTLEQPFRVIASPPQTCIMSANVSSEASSRRSHVLRVEFSDLNVLEDYVANIVLEGQPFALDDTR